jgi:hypothetical protein
MISRKNMTSPCEIYVGKYEYSIPEIATTTFISKLEICKN